MNYGEMERGISQGNFYPDQFPPQYGDPQHQIDDDFYYDESDLSYGPADDLCSEEGGGPFYGHDPRGPPYPEESFYEGQDFVYEQEEEDPYKYFIRDDATVAKGNPKLPHGTQLLPIAKSAKPDIFAHRPRSAKDITKDALDTLQAQRKRPKIPSAEARATIPKCASRPLSASKDITTDAYEIIQAQRKSPINVEPVSAQPRFSPLPSIKKSSGGGGGGNYYTPLKRACSGAAPHANDNHASLAKEPCHEKVPTQMNSAPLLSAIPVGKRKIDVQATEELKYSVIGQKECTEASDMISETGVKFLYPRAPETPCGDGPTGASVRRRRYRRVSKH